MRWRRGDSDEGRASRVKGYRRRVGDGDAWNVGVVGDDDGVAAGGEASSDRDRDRSDGCGGRRDCWRSRVADGAWAVWWEGLVDMGRLGGWFTY